MFTPIPKQIEDNHQSALRHARYAVSAGNTRNTCRNCHGRFHCSTWSTRGASHRMFRPAASGPLFMVSAEGDCWPCAAAEGRPIYCSPSTSVSIPCAYRTRKETHVCVRTDRSTPVRVHIFCLRKQRPLLLQITLVRVICAESKRSCLVRTLFVSPNKRSYNKFFFFASALGALPEQKRAIHTLAFLSASSLISVPAVGK